MHPSDFQNAFSQFTSTFFPPKCQACKLSMESKTQAVLFLAHISSTLLKILQEKFCPQLHLSNSVVLKENYTGRTESMGSMLMALKCQLFHSSIIVEAF